MSESGQGASGRRAVNGSSRRVRFPVAHRLVVWGSALARLRWTLAPEVFLYRPEADSIMGAGVPGDGG